MSKKCNRCGSDVSDDVNFCTNCGGSDFSSPMGNVNAGGFAAAGGYEAQNNSMAGGNVAWSQQPTPQPSYSQPNPYDQQNICGQPNTYDQHGQAAWQQTPSVPEEPKKKRTWIVFLIIGILIVLAIIGFVAEKYFQSQSYGDGDKPDKDSLVQTTGKNDDGEDATSTPTETFEYESESTARPVITQKPVATIAPTEMSEYTLEPTVEPTAEPEKVPYTKGTFDGKTYVNEWSNIEFDLPSGFSDADKSMYEIAESAGADCCFYFVTSSSGFIQYYFESMPYDIIDEKMYLTIVLANFKSSFETAGMTYELIEKDTSLIIAGNTYKNADFSLKNGVKELVCSMYVKRIDNYMSVFCVMGESVSENDTLIKKVSQVK